MCCSVLIKSERLDRKCFVSTKYLDQSTWLLETGRPPCEAARASSRLVGTPRCSLFSKSLTPRLILHSHLLTNKKIQNAVVAGPLWLFPKICYKMLLNCLLEATGLHIPKPTKKSEAGSAYIWKSNFFCKDFFCFCFLFIIYPRTLHWQSP